MRRRLPIVATCVALGLGAPPGCGGAGSPGSTLSLVGNEEVVDGVATSVRGDTAVHEGQTCHVRIQRVSGSAFNCRIRVDCGGDMIYGLGDAGYNRCAERGGAFVTAEDRRGTRGDGDPRMRFDRDRGEVVVTDRDPDVAIVVALARRSL